MNTEEKLLKLRKLADAMYYAAQYLTTDASKLHKAMDEYHQFIIHEYHKEEPTIHDIVNEHWWEMLGEEPVSEDLEEAVNAYIGYAPEVDESSSTYGKRQAFKTGAQWQKEQFEKNRLKHCNSITNEQAELEDKFVSSHIEKNNRMPTYLDAIEYGMKYAEQQKRMAAW